MTSNVRAVDLSRDTEPFKVSRPKRADVEAAFRTIIQWAGDDPNRPGLIETPARVARTFQEFFSGYSQDPAVILQRTFEETEGYDELIVLCGIGFESHCEQPFGTNNRQGLGCIRAEWLGRWNQQACPCSKCVFEALADSGKNDGPDCQHDR